MSETEIVSSNSCYQLLGHLTAQQLADISDLPANGYQGWSAFNDPNHLSNKTLAFKTPTRGVSLYRIWYANDTNNTYGNQQVSGLLAVPDNDALAPTKQRALPLVLFQHGTTFSRDTVPSNVVTFDSSGAPIKVNSAETFFNICQLASSGYALLAADYVGLANSKIPEGYIVKPVTLGAINGMLDSGRLVMESLGLSPQQLFLNGWSQGAVNTQWAVQNYENLGVPVSAAAIQSPFNNLLDTFKQWTTPQLPGDPANGNWTPLTVAMFVYANAIWSGHPELFDALIKDEIVPGLNPDKITYREFLQDFAKDHSILDFTQSTSQFWRVLILRNGASKWSDVPVFTGQQCLTEGVFSQQLNALVSDFLRTLVSDSPLNWKYKTPLRAWYGTQDEALAPRLVDPDLAIFGGTNVSLVPVQNGDHRWNFLNSLYASADNIAGTDQNIISWFNSHLSPGKTSAQLTLEGQDIAVASEAYTDLPVQITVSHQQGSNPLFVRVNRQLKDGTLVFLGTLGGTAAVNGQLQSLGSDEVLLQPGDRLRFQLQSGTGTDELVPSRTEIQIAESAGSYTVNVFDTRTISISGLSLSVSAAARSNQDLSLNRIHSPQLGSSDGLIQLRKGQDIGLQVGSDCGYVNHLGFIRINTDPLTGLPNNTVGDEDIAVNSSLFEKEAAKLLDLGFQIDVTGKQARQGLNWHVAQDGVYAPVLITQHGDVFTYGTFTGTQGSELHLRVLGNNFFGFEDMSGKMSDWDWNDVTVKIVSASN